MYMFYTLGLSWNDLTFVHQGPKHLLPSLNLWDVWPGHISHIRINPLQILDMLPLAMFCHAAF